MHSVYATLHQGHGATGAWQSTVDASGRFRIHQRGRVNVSRAFGRSRPGGTK
jgi:hypothetical protein